MTEEYSAGELAHRDQLIAEIKDGIASLLASMSEESNEGQ